MSELDTIRWILEQEGRSDIFLRIGASKSIKERGIKNVISIGPIYGGFNLRLKSIKQSDDHIWEW